MIQRFAVIGNPIAHSLSPVIHQCFAEQFNIQLSYEKIQGSIHSFEQQVSDFFAQGGKGLNVTLPFKEQAFALAQMKTARSEIAGAANTFWMQNNQLHADNTDGVGFIRDLERYIDPNGKRIIVLGAGGASRGIINPLLETKPASVLIANRTLAKAQDLKRRFPSIHCCDLDSISGEFDLVINATSASIDDKVLFLPAECMAKKPFCYDLAYKKMGPTAFVAHAQALGCEAIDGLGMLVEQAAEGFTIWHGKMPSTMPVLNFLRGSI